MSDTIKKYWEMVEDGEIYDPIISPSINCKLEPILSEGHKKLAYQILIEYPEESILEAARILKVGS
jgi:hypothetical protein